MTEKQLSKVSPDFEQIVSQLQSLLLSKDTWKETITAGTGQTILEAVSAIGAYGQASIERSFLESFLETARLGSSIYTIARMHGVHITRKRPSQVKVRLRKTSNLHTSTTIPKLTQFSIGNEMYFNREPIAFSVGEAEIYDVNLYQGELKNINFISSGETYQKFSFGNNNFSISDEDVYCFVSSTEIEYKRITEGLWKYKGNDLVFYENTKADGNIEILFGNNIYGSIPTKDRDIKIIFSETLGGDYKSLVPNEIITVKGISFIEGNFDRIVNDGDNERTYNYYKNLAPYIYAAKERMVTPNDHTSLTINEYPGVVDATFIGQRDIDPNNKDYMNVVQISVLTITPWEDEQWFNFVRWLKDKKMISCVAQRVNPTFIEIDINAEIYCSNETNLQEARSNVIENLNNTFEPRHGILGFSFYKSDVHKIILESNKGIQFVKLNTPYEDIEITKRQYIKLRNIEILTFYTERQPLI